MIKARSGYRTVGVIRDGQYISPPPPEPGDLPMFEPNNLEFPVKILTFKDVEELRRKCLDPELYFGQKMR